MKANSVCDHVTITRSHNWHFCDHSYLKKRSTYIATDIENMGHREAAGDHCK